MLEDKSKCQIAKELNLDKSTVYRWTRDLPSRYCGWPGIRGKTLDILQELVTKGFVVPKKENAHQKFLLLRKYFPTIYRVTIYNRHIFLLKGKEDVAVRAFLEHTRKKIISYQELRQITKVFGTDISKKRRSFSEKEGNEGLKTKGFKRMVLSLRILIRSHFFAFGGTGRLMILY